MLLNLKSSVVVAAVTVALAAPAFGQSSQGILAGVVRDATGAAVPHATISVTNQNTGEKRTVTTSGDGAYRIEAISPGRYTITGTASGFANSQIQNVAVVPSAVTSYNLVLQIGSAATEVTVEANQGEINTDNGVLSGTIGTEQLDKAPIFTLNPVEMTTTVPGVQPVSTPSGQLSNGVNIQVNGARPRSNNFLMDGQEINDIGIGGQAFQPQIPDMFNSVTIFTNSASAEYGRAGGGIVNMVTKAGTNQYHGTVFERYTGSGLNSIPGDFRGSPDFTKTRFDQHTYGFTAGGRIIRDKLFAFGGLEIQRYYGQETPGVNLLPDAAGYATLQSITGSAASQVKMLDQYLSNGSYLSNNIQYPSSGKPITFNVGVLPGCPSAGCVVSFAGFQRPNAPESSPETQWMYRVDWTPWDKDHVYFRYMHDRLALSPDFFNNGYALAGFDTEQGGPTELGAGAWTHVFGPRLVNEFRVSEARLAFTFSPTAQTVANPLNNLYSISFAKLSGTTSAGSLTFPVLGPNQNFPQGRKEDLYQFQDTVRYTLGRQSISIGADTGRLIEIDLVSQNALGQLSFASGGNLPGDPNHTNCPTFPNCVAGNSLGNFLQNQLGPSGSATKTFGKTRADAHGYRNGIFVQDDIKISSDLSLNVGLRYDFLTNPENTLPFPGVDPHNVFAPINTVVPIKNDYNNLAPRFGFAYSPHGVLGFLGDGKTSIRGGFGVFYDSTFSNILVNSTQSSPNAVAGTLIQTTGNGLTNATSLIPTISPTLNPLSTVTSEDSNLVNPITYEYNLGIEREIPGQIVLGVRYVGNRGEKLFANQQFNYFVGTTGARVNPARGAINLRGNYADSNYNGLEITGTHNFKHGLLVNANYVFSKDLDNGSEIFTLGTSSTSYSANLAPGGRRQDWGPSAYDHRQFFSVVYVYVIPGLRSSNHLTDLAENILTRNWTVSGVTQLQSGSYSTFNTNGFDLNGDGSTSNDRPVVINKSADIQSVGVDGHFVGGKTGVFYDLAANNASNGTVLNPVNVNSVHFLVPYFPNNSFLTQEIGRNSFQLPGTTTNNIALEKGFDIKERARFILRAEAQNVFNHNDRTIGDLDVLDAGVGFMEPSRTAAPAIGDNQRTLVLWGKFQF